MLWQKILTRKGEYGVSNRGEVFNLSYWGQVRLAEKMAFEQRLQRGERVSLVVVWRKGIRGKRQSECKGTEIGEYLASQGQCD